MKKTIKINSEKLWSFINELSTNEKVKFKVYYDGNYVTEILWDGENFEWESGTFASQAFFNPMYDFEPLGKEEFEDIEEINVFLQRDKYFIDKINQLIKNQKKIIERINKME